MFPAMDNRVIQLLGTDIVVIAKVIGLYGKLKEELDSSF